MAGLGYTFVDRSGFGSSIGRRMNLGMYKFANRLADEVAFQNPDDMDLLKTRGGIAHSKGRFITGGSGVDVTEYHPGTRNTAESIELRKSLGIAEDAFVTMFVGRLQLDKGLVEFVEAARMVKQ